MCSCSQQHILTHSVILFLCISPSLTVTPIIFIILLFVFLETSPLGEISLHLVCGDGLYLVGWLVLLQEVVELDQRRHFRGHRLTVDWFLSQYHFLLCLLACSVQASCVCC